MFKISRQNGQNLVWCFVRIVVCKMRLFPTDFQILCLRQNEFEIHPETIL